MAFTHARIHVCAQRYRSITCDGIFELSTIILGAFVWFNGRRNWNEACTLFYLILVSIDWNGFFSLAYSNTHNFLMQFGVCRICSVWMNTPKGNRARDYENIAWKMIELSLHTTIHQACGETFILHDSLRRIHIVAHCWIAVQFVSHLSLTECVCARALVHANNLIIYEYFSWMVNTVNSLWKAFDSINRAWIDGMGGRICRCRCLSLEFRRKSTNDTNKKSLRFHFDAKPFNFNLPNKQREIEKGREWSECTYRV